MTQYSYYPQGVCAKRIFFALEEGRIHNIQFVGGCPGNLQAIAKLLENQDATMAIERLKGNTCGNKPTSCADQLAQALEKAMQQEHA
ncbi:MAG: TIGR03905 family TSCPD domain-containing protein [Desulfovibrionaceae bacterium]|nr:TIGR03905 family TSCPD domain-containing protein [Desulfovibrionaceae bacterium]